MQFVCTRSTIKVKNKLWYYIYIILFSPSALAYINIRLVLKVSDNRLQRH